MPVETAQSRDREPVVQFSVFTPNRLGRLHDLMAVLSARDVHILALTVLDTTDCAIIRLVADDPERARALLGEQGFPFSESPLLAVEMNSAEDLPKLSSALLAAELNIHYLYAFVPQPQGKPVLGLSLEDVDLAERVLQQHQFRVLKQGDISR